MLTFLFIETSFLLSDVVSLLWLPSLSDEYCTDVLGFKILIEYLLSARAKSCRLKLYYSI